MLNKEDEKLLALLQRDARASISDLARALAPFRVVVDVAQDTPPVMADPVLIGQALVNLLENATKYAPEGSTIRLTAAPVPEGGALTVIDEGPGIPVAERGRVFDLFHRAVQGDGQPAGTGLGLALAQQVARAFDRKAGEVRVRRRLERPFGSVRWRADTPDPRQDTIGYLGP